MNEDVRWKQRFDNFRRAYKLLSQVIQEYDDITKLEPIVQEGIIKRFEFTLELAWKTIKDKMQYDGLIIHKISPKPLLKQAYQSGYIQDIDQWIKMVNDRNLMAHTYDFSQFSQVLGRLQKDYYVLLEKLYDDLLTEYLG